MNQKNSQNNRKEKLEHAQNLLALGKKAIEVLDNLVSKLEPIS